jgi:hypothetical protein
MKSDWFKMHKKIKKIVENKKGCVDVQNISKEINADIQDILEHFEVMKIDGYGNFMDEEKKIFCNMNNAVEVFNYITKEDIIKAKQAR